MMPRNPWRGMTARTLARALFSIGLATGALAMAALAPAAFAPAAFAQGTGAGLQSGGPIPFGSTGAGGSPTQNVLHLTGDLQPRATVKVFARASGLVDKIHVRESSLLRRGQVIAEIDPDEYQIEVNISQAAVAAMEARSSMMAAGGRPAEQARAAADIALAEAVLRDAEANFTRFSNLAAKGGAPRQQADAAEREMNVARARLTTARKSASLVKDGPREEEQRMARADLSKAREQLKMAEIRLGYTKVRAPFDGIVGQRLVDEGTYVLAASSPQAPAMFVVSDSRVMKGLLDIPESELMKVRVGQKATVRVQSLPDRVFTASVANVYPYVDPRTRNGKVELAVPNHRAELLSGMFIKADIEVTGDRARSLADVLGVKLPERSRGE